MNAFRIVVWFLVFGISWIMLSDRAVELSFEGAMRDQVQSIKGLLFVLLSAGLIFALVRRAERRQQALEIETRREKDRLAFILNVNPAVIYSLQPIDRPPGFGVEFIGQNVEGLTGLPSERWLSEPGLWFRCVHPEDHAKVAQAQQTLMQEGSVRYEYRFRHANGEYRWFHDHLVLLRCESGQPRRILGSWLDVTERVQAEQAMADSALRYRALFEANPVPMWVYDLETLRFLSVNAAAVHHYGHTKAEFLDLRITDIRSPEERERLLRVVEAGRGQPSGPRQSGEWEHQDKSGRRFWVEIRSHQMDYEGRPACLVLAQDITDRRAAEERLRLIGHVFEASQEGIFITDAQARFVSVNRAFTTVTGFTIDDVRGQTPALLKSGRQDRRFYADMWGHLLREGRWEGEIWNRRKSGELFPEWLSVSAIRDARGGVQQYLGIFTETSGRKAAEERILRLANYDLLTGLPNRALLHDRASVALAAAAAHQGRVGVMHLNVDHFGKVNESYGQAVGDQVLIALSQRIAACLRSEDTASRLGSDDFILLLPGQGSHEAAQLAVRLMAAVSAPLQIEGTELRLTASIGLVEFPENGADFPTLAQAAESAVHQAKREGRNTFNFFSRRMQEQVHADLAVEQDLRHAIERHELLLHYQPQIDAGSGRIVGCEALVRWQHPQRGLVAPGVFIPVAEESGLIRDIGQWVMGEALRQTAQWRAEGRTIVPVAVNLSVVQFRHAGLRDSVIEALRRSGLPAHFLELELTESVAMENSDYTITTIDGLKRLGVQLSIDDFGTGYSSLSYLKRFAVDKLKIDQSFVRGLNYDANDEAIVATIINLARSLGLRTIAEGVETAGQRDFLLARGCDEYQGYFFSRPVPAADFAELLGRPDLAPLPPAVAA